MNTHGMPNILTREQLHLRAQLAAHAMHAQGKTSTQAGTAAFMARFEREVDPEGRLTPEERTRRAKHARKAYMLGLAYRSSRARAARGADDRALVHSILADDH